MNGFGRLQTVTAILVTLLVAAFVVSFATGLRTGARDGVAGNGPVVQPPPDSERRIRVEVLNAAGRGGLAREATRRLRDQGIDVVYFGNARDFGLEKSVVLDRAGDAEAAARVAEALGIAEVRGEPDPELMLEATVLVGLDWPSPELKEPEALGERIRRLWRRVTGGR